VAAGGDVTDREGEAVGVGVALACEGDVAGVAEPAEPAPPGGAPQPRANVKSIVVSSDPRATRRLRTAATSSTRSVLSLGSPRRDG